MALEDRIANFEEAVAELEGMQVRGQHISTADFETFDGVAGERTKVASHQFDSPVALKDGETLDIDLVAYESTGADGNAGNQETVALSQSIDEEIDIPEPVVVYEDGSRLDVDSIDYANDEIQVTPANADSTLHIFYASSDQAQLELRKTAPNGVYESLGTYDISLVNFREQARRPLEFEAEHPLQGVIPQDWTLDVYVKGPYVVSWGIDTDGDDEIEATPDNQLISVPIARGRGTIPEFARDAIRQTASVV